MQCEASCERVGLPARCNCRAEQGCSSSHNICYRAAAGLIAGSGLSAFLKSQDLWPAKLSNDWGLSAVCAAAAEITHYPSWADNLLQSHILICLVLSNCPNTVPCRLGFLWAPAQTGHKQVPASCTPAHILYANEGEVCSCVDIKAVQALNFRHCLAY